MKKILITGTNSYIGNSLSSWLARYPDDYSIDTISLRDDTWKAKDFSYYNVVLHLAAVVHKKEKPDNKSLYFEVNRNLAIEVAKKARLAGVKQFIFMSTMAVYGEDGKIDENVVITRDTIPNPKTFYAKSKLEAEYEINKLRNDNFRITIIRPPMVYGPNSPGNYLKLEKIAKVFPIFPMIGNRRSMLNIDNLCYYIKKYIDQVSDGIFFPQDDKYMNTSLLVKKLAKKNGRTIILSKFLGWNIKFLGRRFKLTNKVFGNLIYQVKK